jgi:EAL domain-containing protein (putative c-di-GMP-specific phosphodiesterase class I)
MVFQPIVDGSVELDDPSLHEPAAPLSRVASRVVLEMTERTRLEHSGRSSFALLEPDVVKLDMSLVRDIHCAYTKRKLVGSLLQVCSDPDLLVVAGDRRR